MRIAERGNVLGEDERSIQKHFEVIEQEMKKPHPDLNLLHDKLKRTPHSSKTPFLHNVAKPQQPTTPHNINNIFNTQSIQQISTRFPILQRNATLTQRALNIYLVSCVHAPYACSTSATHNARL
jgi:hypothetical protein